MYLYVSKFTNDPNALLYLSCRSHIKIILQHIRIYIFTANKNKLLLLALMQHANCRPTATQKIIISLAFMDTKWPTFGSLKLHKKFLVYYANYY